MRSPSAATALVPGLFVLIWATGFVTARLVAPHAEPIAFVAARCAATAVLLLAIARWRGVRWPRGRAMRATMVVGVLMQGVYITGVFWSVNRGLPAGIAALVGSLQPLLTAAIVGPLLGEVVSARRWIGIAAGFAGVILVLTPKLGAADPSGIPLVALAVCTGAMLALTFGTIQQKRFIGETDLLASAALQFLAASLVTVPFAVLFGDWRFDPVLPLAAGYAWSVLINSVASILLMLALIRRGAVVGVASLLFLVPPVSAVIAYAMFGETLTLVQVAGMAVAAVGVAVASRSR